MGIQDLLNSTGSMSFSFDTIGASVTGTIVSAEVVAKRNFDTMEPEFWDDGKPMQQVRVILATSLREATADGIPDDGHRAVYVKAWGDGLKALKAAITAAGDDDLHPGGTFTATYVSDIPVPAGKRGFPTKQYAYAYAKPSKTAALLGQPAATPPPGWAAQIETNTPAPVAPPAAPAAPAAAPMAVPPSWEAFQQAQATPPPPAPPATPALPPMDEATAARYAAWVASQNPGES